MDALKGAYGAGMSSTSGFDPVSFLKKPTVVFRLVALLCGLIVWLAVSGGAWHKPIRGGAELCLYGGTPSTCSFGSALGFFAVMAALALIASDAYFDRISSVNNRKKMVMTDLGVSVAFACLFTLTFLILASKYSSLDLDEPYSSRSVKAGIFFSFLSTLVWGGASFFAWRRYQEGAQIAFAPPYDSDFHAIGGGAATMESQSSYGYGYDQQGGQQEQPSYQNAPFTAANSQFSPVDPRFKQPY